MHSGHSGVLSFQMQGRRGKGPLGDTVGIVSAPKLILFGRTAPIEAVCTVLGKAKRVVSENRDLTSGCPKGRADLAFYVDQRG